MEELLERDDSMGFLGEVLGAIRLGGEGRLVLVGGQAGVGKTALLRRFCDRAEGRVLWGACEPLRTPRPLGPLLDVAEETGGELAELVAGAARPHEVAAALLRELRGDTPAVLVLEDVHWADEATLDVLTLLGPRIGAAPALVLASYRDDELDRSEQLRFLLGEVVRRPGRMRLLPLSVAAVTELARPHGIDGAELHRRTGGNPFFVIEALASGSDEIPDTVRDAILARASRLSSDARTLLEAVAIVPGHVDLWLLELLAGQEIDRLDECLASGMLTAGRAHVAFRHELARAAIEEATAPNRRLALHRAALGALAERDADVTRLSHHADAADDAEGVLRWAPPAAEKAAGAGAHREAAAQYARALRFATGTAERAELLARRADECYMTAEIDVAVDAQREALHCYRGAGDRRAEADAVRVLSRLLFFAGRVEEGEAAALEAVALLAQLPPGRELAMAFANVSQRRMVTEDTEAAIAWATRAHDLAERLGDDEVALYALTNIGGAELRAGRLDGEAKLERAIAIAREQGFEEHAARAIQLLVLSHLRHCRYDAAGAQIEAGLAYCEEHGLETWRLYLLADTARRELALGRWDAATAAAAAVLHGPVSVPVARSWALGVLGLVRARRGDPDVDGPLDEAQALVESTAELMRIGPISAARAEAAWLAGDAERVAAVTAAGLALARERGASWVIGELAFWRRQAGLDEPLDDAAGPYVLGWREAAARWREIGCPYEAALALAASDDEEVVLGAVEELQRLGAVPAARIVGRQLRERGVRGVPRGPQPKTLQNPAGLTARELEVLALLVEGLRNAQIATRLVVSEKTVGHHVSAVLRKLDVQSRGEAAAKATRLGLTK